MRAYGTLEASIQIFLEDVAVRPITPEICALGALFPDDYSHDPADRIIGGTARAEGLTLITHDEKIRRSPLLKTVWEKPVGEIASPIKSLKDWEYDWQSVEKLLNGKKLVVVLQPQVRNQLLALQIPERILQLHQLNE